MIGTLVLVLAQAGGSQPAAYAARPPECGVLEGFKAANVWERAKEPELRRYCDLLASGTAKLVGQATLAKDVLGIADQADALMPGRAAPKVLAGRAHLRLGDALAARKSLEEARARDDRALDDPVALLAWARANARTGNLDEAARAYRAALPRTSALSAQERSAASFEAGMAVMSRGIETVDDAVAMLRQARRDAQDAMQVASVVGLALGLDRAGQREEARAVLGERIRRDVTAMLDDPRVVAALDDSGVPHEAEALRALALEGAAPEAAREAWRAFLAKGGAKGPWAEHARARAGLGGASKPAPAPAAAPRAR